MADSPCSKVDGTLDDGAVLSSQWSGDGSGGGSDPAARDPEVFPVDFPVPDHGCENTAADQMLCDDCSDRRCYDRVG